MIKGDIATLEVPRARVELATKGLGVGPIE